MNRLFYKKHLFLFLSILFCVLSVFVWYFFVYKTNLSNVQHPVQTISQRVNNELEALADFCKSIKGNLESKEQVNYSGLTRFSAYPFFVFKNKNLQFWSDNSFIPDYESLKGSYGFRFVQFRNGKFIVYKQLLIKGSNTFEIAVFLPLSAEYSVQNNYVTSGLNKKIFNSFPFVINATSSKQENNIYSSTGEFLFSLEVPQDHNYRNEWQMLLLILLIAVAVVFLFLYLFHWVFVLQRNKKPGLSIILLGMGLIVIRGIMLGFDYPFSLYEYDLFNSKYFASSSVSPSLGDVLLNTIAIIIFSVFLFRHYRNTSFFKWIVNSEGVGKDILSVVLAFVSFFALYLVFYIITILSSHSQWSLDITRDIDFNIFRIISLVIFISVVVVYFIYSHILFRIFISLNDGSLKKNILYFFAGTLLYIVASYISEDIFWVLILGNIAYFLLLYFTDLPRTVGGLKYSTYLYYLTCALLCSVTGAYSIYRQNLDQTIYEKQHYATDLVFKRDVSSEFLLSEASEKITGDRFIQSRLVTPLSSKGVIEQKIRRVFLSDNTFDKYEVVVSVFDYNGNVYERKSDYSSYHEAVQKYYRDNYKTEHSGIYFIADTETGAKKYLCFNEIKMDGVVVGYVIVELKHKKAIPHSVYPELLINNYSDRTGEIKVFDYAVYSNQNLLYSFGNFNFAKSFNVKRLNEEDLYKDGVESYGYHHLGVQLKDGKKIVVSSEKYHLKKVYSNFSFFFLLLILFILIFIIVYAAYFNTKENTTYATKIQIYLNIAFFLPLFIVSITTLSIISASYKDNLNNAFIKKAEDISLNINDLLKTWSVNENYRERLENNLSQIAHYTEADISLFNHQGKLIYTNQPMIYELGFLSNMINPIAFEHITENSSNLLMISEKIGKLKYNSVYVSIRSQETNDLLAILSMPFFESKSALDKQIIHVLTTIVNIFVSIFILFLALSYFASHILTVPLKIITQKLKKTTLEKNEPIEWNTKDEIGLLVEEYNSMLVKLEESRLELSKSEKESAWREMAKQVAHEIKNPLTPMKLTIQHLQRSVENKDAELGDKTKKALNVLLDQVNNLSEIATSFSMFAKMPIPKNQRFEVGAVLLKTAALHNNSKEVDVQTYIEKGEFYVLGDEQLMSGIFTNLILNGLQSVPNDRKAQIFVRLSSVDSKVRIEVKDNGTGIPAHIRDKVFLPNFSTKFAGSGIGLAVAKRGVEHAGGRIWFETLEGTGTSFYIEIPLID